MDISDRTTDALNMAIKFRQMRQDLIASNIANSETPEYKAKRIDFEEAMAQALDTEGTGGLKINNPSHYNASAGGLEKIAPEVYDDPNGVVREDGNTVDRDYEMTMMAENKIYYDAAVQLLNKKIGLMKYAISSDH